MTYLGHPFLSLFFGPLTGRNNFFSQTAYIIAEPEVYVDILREHARKGDVSLGRSSLVVHNPAAITCLSRYFRSEKGVITDDSRRNSRLQSQKKYNQLASALRSQVNGYYMKHALNPVMINVHTCEPAAGIYTGVALKFNCMSSIEYLSLILAITGGLLWCE